MKLTVKERAVLEAIKHNHFQCAGPDDQAIVGNAVWSDCINDSDRPSGVYGKALSGVVSSLMQKGLIAPGCPDSLCLTEKGFAR